MVENIYCAKKNGWHDLQKAVEGKDLEKVEQCLESLKMAIREEKTILDVHRAADEGKVEEVDSLLWNAPPGALRNLPYWLVTIAKEGKSELFDIVFKYTKGNKRLPSIGAYLLLVDDHQYVLKFVKREGIRLDKLLKETETWARYPRPSTVQALRDYEASL